MQEELANLDVAANDRLFVNFEDARLGSNELLSVIVNHGVLQQIVVHEPSFVLVLQKSLYLALWLPQCVRCNRGHVGPCPQWHGLFEYLVAKARRRVSWRQHIYRDAEFVFERAL